MQGLRGVTVKEQIGKVVLNYEYYSGVDSYSDGNIEDDLLELVKREEPEKIIQADHRWPILYHLSPVRQNILEWYPMDPEATVLEVGAGCGAITGVLSRKAKRVVCVELSKRRSLINANRNRDCDNVEIMVGNFNDVQLNEKFDYITLIGVLEYAAYYTDAENPFEAFLENLRTMLKPEGKLLIAIENKYGLKYWAGVKEDHTGMLFDGLEGYHNTQSAVKTFSKDQLNEMIRHAGYKNADFYYPFPDYKFPTQIFSDEYLPKTADFAYDYSTYDNDRLMLFNETAVYQELLADGKFPFFSNSFFIEATNEVTK